MPKTFSLLVRLTRITLLLTTASALFLTQTSTGFAAVRASKPHKVTHASHKSVTRKKAHDIASLPAQGIFDSCNLSSSLSTCEQDLLQMKQAGLKVAVVGAEWDSTQDLSSYAAYAQSIGMSVMWELNDPGFWGGAWIGSSAAGDWPAFSTACGCTSTAQVLSSIIQFLSQLPATYGYYAADDSTLDPSQVSGLRQYVAEIKAVDSNHMVMVGSAEGDGTTYYPTGATIGNEIYPETTQSLMPYNSNQGLWLSVQQSVSQDQRAASNAGTDSAFILQAFSFGDNLSDGEAVGVCTPSMSEAQCANLLQYPAASVQLELRNEALQNAHPKLILWYTYSQASQGGRWADLASTVSAQYPASATVASAKSTRKVSGKHGAHRHSVGHTLAA